MATKYWEKWEFPTKEIAELCIEFDVIPLFHLDSNWGPGLEVFRELPPKKGILALDGQTDIFKAKEVLGDVMCIMGDVQAQKLAYGKPEEVYDYSMKLIKEIGPNGFILCSGCDIPFNAKYLNFTNAANSLYISQPALIFKKKSRNKED